jgi:hypothetical protein
MHCDNVTLEGRVSVTGWLTNDSGRKKSIKAASAYFNTQNLFSLQSILNTFYNMQKISFPERQN